MIRHEVSADVVAVNTVEQASEADVIPEFRTVATLETPMDALCVALCLQYSSDEDDLGAYKRAIGRVVGTDGMSLVFGLVDHKHSPSRCVKLDMRDMGDPCADAASLGRVLLTMASMGVNGTPRWIHPDLADKFREIQPAGPTDFGVRAAA